MKLESYLGELPAGAEIVSPHLAIVRSEGQVEFYNASGPIYSCGEADRVGLRLAQGMFCQLGLAGPTALGKALEVDQSTVHRNRHCYQAGGVAALLGQRGPRSPHKLSDEKCAQAQRGLDAGESLRAVARQVGVSEGALRYALKHGRLRRGPSPQQGTAGVGVKGPATRSSEDQASAAGVAVKRHAERGLARAGLLAEAPVQFEAAEGVANAGVLVALPALLAQGVLVVGEQVYGNLKQGFFGLQSVLLLVAFMALLRIKTPDQLQRHAPGELGRLLGLDRAPEVKTLRRKLYDLGARGQARTFTAALTERWAHEEPDALGYLYIDGHVRPYHGRTHTLPKTRVARRRLCMPATTDFGVNDAQAEPLFFVTAEAHDSLLSIVDGAILPEIRTLVGTERRVTLIFDREGWSPKTFAKWAAAGFDVMSYRKGQYEPWPEEAFFPVTGQVDGKPVQYQLGQRSIQIAKGFWIREVRRLCDSGHQTSVVTTRQDLPLEEVAYRMFSRWRQENFFRYMRQEYDLDHLLTYAVEPADPQRLVPNPARKAQKKTLEKLRRELATLKKDYGQQALDNPEHQRPTMRGFKIANATKLGQPIRQLERQCQEAEAMLKALPEKVPLNTLKPESEIVQLELERKVLSDTLKLVAYRAETALFKLLHQPFFARHEDEGRAFLKALFQTPADLLPDPDNGCLVVRLHTMANPRSNYILSTLCEILNQEQCLYPGTQLRLVFEPPGLHSNLRPCQEF